MIHFRYPHVFQLLLWLTLWINLPRVLAQEQAPFQITVVPAFLGAPLELNTTVYLPDSQSIAISVCKFYLGQFAFLDGQEVVWQANQPYHLFDLSDSLSYIISLDPPTNLTFDQIQFRLGVDSSTTASGIFGGDLDPMKGMYWAWNSGYIHAKLEGFSLIANSPNHPFLFHIGGYLAPYGASQVVSLPVATDRHQRLIVELEALFKQIDLTNSNQIMSPSGAAVEFAEKLAQSFTWDVSDE